MLRFEGDRMRLGSGALGTQLLERGLPPGTPPEQWNLERPETVAEVHAAWAAAGAEWLVTNTFGGSRPRLEAYGLAARIEEIQRAAVAAAHAGAPELPLLGSLGPTLAPEPAAWERAYAEQAELLAAAGVEAFLVETILRLEEGAAAVRAARAAGARFVLAAYTPVADGGLSDGTPPERAAEALRAAGADAVGLNCGCGPESLLEPVRRLARVGFGPLYVAPSAGLPLPAPDGPARRTLYPLGPDAFARSAIQFRDAGVRFFAGCCGTTPEHLRAAAAALGR